MNIPYKYHWYHFIWRWCYNLVLILLLPLGILKLLLKSDKTKGQRNRNRERFGLIGKPTKQGILVHCVSVGEVNAAKNIVLCLQRRHPELAITISTTSSTGAKQARAVFLDSVQHVYLPVDIPICMWLFFHQLRPKLVLVTEVEIWPNMLHQCFRLAIPAVLINGRMTNESVKNYQHLAFLVCVNFHLFARRVSRTLITFSGWESINQT
jgi:3-deoxy-D-manno-octulosonic-acid transferase